MTAALAFLAGTLGVLGAWQLAHHAGEAVARHAPAAARTIRGLVETVLRLGREGREPGALERRRLLAAGASAALIVGWLLAGPFAGLALAAAGPFAGGRALRARRLAYRRAVEEGAPGMAVAIADAVGGGHSVRGALEEAARCAPGPAGHELRRVVAELAAGARTEDALEALRARMRSDRVDLLVAACLLQRRAGGDLSRLLRDCAASFEDDGRLRGEVRAATAQARFTGLIVVLMPLGGALLAELASPGFLAGLAGSFLTLWLVGFALALQVTAAVLIRRLGRPRW